MIPQKLKIIQLMDCNGDCSGLYTTEREDIENFQEYFDAAFSTESEDIREDADDWLETHKQIFRIFAEEVYTNKI